MQRELSSNTAVMLAYVGTRGSNLTAVLTSAGFSGDVSSRLTTVSNVGSSKYDSLQVTLRRNLSSGLSYLAAYTFAHATDNTTGPFPGPQSTFLPTDSGDLDKDEGDANFDVRHRFTVAATYELPFAKDNAILGGWSLNSIVTLQTGTPFTVFAGGRRANVSGDPNGGPKTSDEWFDTSVFSQAPDGQQGNSKRNAVRGPGIRTIDLSLFKSFKLGERAGLELRIEGFNVLNSPQYGFPNQFFGDANFGRITTTRQNSERQVQLAARLTF